MCCIFGSKSQIRWQTRTSSNCPAIFDLSLLSSPFPSCKYFVFCFSRGVFFSLNEKNSCFSLSCFFYIQKMSKFFFHLTKSQEFYFEMNIIPKSDFIKTTKTNCKKRKELFFLNSQNSKKKTNKKQKMK